MSKTLVALSFVTLVCGLPAASVAQVPPAEQKKLMKQLIKLQSDKKLSDEEKQAKAKTLQDEATAKWKAQASAKTAPPKFECIAGKGKLRVKGEAVLPAPAPGQFVWLELKRFESADLTQIHTQQHVCGVGFTTKATSMQFTYGVEQPGFYVFAVHLDTDGDNKQSREAGKDSHAFIGGTAEAPASELSQAKPVELKAGQKAVTGVVIPITVAAAPAAPAAPAAQP